MPNYPAPVLEIINGSTTINLLARGKGWHLTGFRPRTAEAVAQWQSSPLSNGRQPVSYRYDNIIDTWTVTADGYNEDGIIELAQELERAGGDALDYWVADWATTPVYIRARGPHETNTRYAIIHQIRVPEYADQYRQPMFNVNEPVIDGISVIIEHGQWQNVAPGDQECVQVSSTLAWSAGIAYGNLDTVDGDVLTIVQTSSGRILVGTNGTAKIYYSDDDGANWGIADTLGTDPADAVNDIKQNPVNGYVYAAVSGVGGVQGLYHSTDDGSTWTLTDGNQFDAYCLSFDSSGNTLYSGAEIGRILNTANGLAFESASPSVTYKTASVTPPALSTRWVRIGVNAYYETSSDLSGGIDYKVISGSGVGLVVVSNTAYFLTGSGNFYSKTVGDYSSATLVYTLPETCYCLERFDSTFYAGAATGIYVSTDNGVSWSKQYTTSTAVRAISDTTESFFLYGQDDAIASSQIVDTETTMGRAATCNNEVYASNKQQSINLVSILVYDASGTSYTEALPMSSFPVNLLPSVPAANDACYFGIPVGVSGLVSGPFSSLIFDLAEPFVGWTDVEWEYWNGSTWAALTVKDSTLSLLQTGVNSVHWVPPSDWATTAVNSVTGYWVRFRVVTVATSPEPPSQQNRNVYAVVNPFVEVASAQIGGDIPALARVRVENVSDGGGSAPTLYSNRVLMGLRSVDRGALFTAFLNASDEQNPVGVTVTAGSDTSFIDAIGAPSGRLAQWSPAGTGSWVTILTFSLATTIATQYYGTFRVFLRARQSGGTAGQMTLRLRTSSGSGGVSITSETKTFANTNDFQILDFGQLTIPLSAYLKATELGDTLTIAVQGNTSSTTPDCNMYDLVLIPVDEWAADLTDGENSASSALASGYYLDVDSVSFPKRQLRNAVKATGTDYTKAIWQQVANGPAILQANARQRLWLLSMRTASAGSTDWRSEPDVVHRVQMWSAERYRWARGAR